MPNIQQLLSEELRRQARKEVRTELVELKTQLTTMRKTIAEQNRRIKALEKIVPLPVKPQPSAEVPAEVKPIVSGLLFSRLKSSEINLDFHRVNSLLCWVSISIRFVIGNPEKSNREKPRNAKSRQSATWGNVSWQS